MTCGVTQDTMCLTTGETWPIEDTLHGTDGLPLDLTGAVITLTIHDDANVILVQLMDIASPPTSGIVHASISPVQQAAAGLIGYAVYFFVVKAVLSTGEITFQNRGLLYVSSDPLPGV